jgi:hypothetical protein
MCPLRIGSIYSHLISHPNSHPNSEHPERGARCFLIIPAKYEDIIRCIYSYRSADASDSRQPTCRRDNISEAAGVGVGEDTAEAAGADMAVQEGSRDQADSRAPADSDKRGLQGAAAIRG